MNDETANVEEKQSSEQPPKQVGPKVVLRGQCWYEGSWQWRTSTTSLYPLALAEAQGRVHELEKRMAVCVQEAQEARKKAGEAEAVCDRLRSRAELAEGDLELARMEVSAKESEVVRLEREMKESGRLLDLDRGPW